MTPKKETSSTDKDTPAEKATARKNEDSQKPVKDEKAKSTMTTTDNKASLPVALYLIMSTLFGFIGGWFAVQNNASGEVTTQPSRGQQIVLNESDAIAKIADDVGPSVVSVNVVSSQTSQSFFFGNQTYEAESEGTGIILTADGLIVTNKHVIGDTSTDITIVLSDGTKYDNVDIIGRDPLNDIAFLQIKDVSGLTPATLGDSSQMRVGDKAIAIGNALGQFDNTVTAGIISGIGRPIVAVDGIDAEQLQNLFQTDTAINPGNSGGPLVNINGEVIGINTAVAGNAENIGFAIPINDVKPSIKSVQDNGRIVRPYLGVRYVAITDDIASELDLSVKRGALITAGAGQTAVLPDSPADKAGLKEDDIITKVQDTLIDEKHPLVTTVSQYQVGETITLTILRDGQEMSIAVVLAEAPDNL